MRRLVVALGWALIGASSVAHADWQYTKWGMSPAQVAAASHGAVQQGSGDPSDRYNGSQIGATGTYTSGNYQFKAVFYCVDGKLSDVRLSLLSGDRFALKNALMGVYGKAFDESKILQLTTWHDTAKNNRIDLLMIGDSTTLEYRPLKDGSAVGL